MTIDPRVGMWLSIVLTTIAVLTTAGTQLTTLFGQSAATLILAACVILMGIGNAVNAVLHAIPSVSGPQAAAQFSSRPQVLIQNKIGELMRKIIIAAMMALAVSGCVPVMQKIDNAWNVLTASSISPEAVVIAVNSFDALEATATNYLRLERCNGANGPICRDPAATSKLVPAIRSGRVARNNLEQFLKDHPGQLGPSGLYDALQTAITTIQNVITQYKIGASS
jgi:hypothetical protein